MNLYNIPDDLYLKIFSNYYSFNNYLLSSKNNYNNFIIYKLDMITYFKKVLLFRLTLDIESYHVNKYATIIQKSSIKKLLN